MADIESLAPKPSALESVIIPIENAMAAMGLVNPAHRLLFGMAAGTAASFALKPRLMFNEKGEPRPWVVQDPGAKGSTAFPFWMPGVGLGLLLGVYI